MEHKEPYYMGHIIWLLFHRLFILVRFFYNDRIGPIKIKTVETVEHDRDGTSVFCNIYNLSIFSS